LEAVVATYLIRHWPSGRAVFDRPHDVLRCAQSGAALAPSVSARVGPASLELTGLAGWSVVGPIWLTRWLGDAAGPLRVAPAVLAVTSLVLGAAVLDRTRTEKRLLAVEQHSRLAAEEGERLREEFLSVATHELRTPVAAVSGYAQLAQRALAANRSDRLGDAVDSIVRQSPRLAALITQLLDASYVQRGQFEIEPRPTDISAVAGW